jgi:hypothetical protein
MFEEKGGYERSKFFYLVECTHLCSLLCVKRLKGFLFSTIYIKLHICDAGYGVDGRGLISSGGINLCVLYYALTCSGA